MQTLNRQNSIILAAVLSLAMWATRGHHLASLTHLPDASWALFFLLGFYLRQRIMLPVFLAQAALIDYFAITQFGVDNYCVTPAYAFLLPAYAAMWLAGRWYAARYTFNARTLPTLAASAVIGTATCELISSGSFYFLGGKAATTSLGGFAWRLAEYFPFDLASALMYLGAAALLHGLVVTARRSAAAAQ
jgi:hypothetical protein